MIRVLGVDDHVIMRNGLKQLFTVMGGITMAGEAADGGAALALLAQQPFDLILLDMIMPGLCGIKLIHAIRAITTEVPILIYSMHGDLQMTKQGFMAGASGYVAKGSGQDTLIQAINKVAAGERFVDPMVAEQMVFEGMTSFPSPTTAPLSSRESQILKLLAKGQSLNEIAEANVISCKTVSTYKRRLMTKLNLKNNADLVRYAVERHLVD